MKKLTVVVAGLAALAIASNASAQTTNIVRITGATAYRAAAHAALTNIIEYSTLKYGYVGSSFTGAGQAEFRGLLKNNTEIYVDIKTSWNGSVDGLQRLVNRGNSAYNVTNWLNAADGVLLQGGKSGVTPGTESAPADLAMSDVFPNTTKYGDGIEKAKVGVIPFVWAKNKDCPASVSNVTSMIAQQLLTGGSVPLSFFSGVDTDTNRVYVIGRNADSGTRVTTFAETGFGVFGSPAQKKVNYSTGGGVTNVTSIVPYPGEPLLGETYLDGQSGYGSGGTVATVLNANGSTNSTVTNPGWIVGYVSYQDAKSVQGGANILKYNGVDYSDDAVRKGQYSFWSYEVLCWTDYVGEDDTLTEIKDAIKNEMLSFDPSTVGAIKWSTMKVQRGIEGGPISEGSGL
jgi:hypothetical protein